MLSTLGCMIGRSERAPVEVESYWETGSTFPNFLYRCADGELIQVWFGGKGMYAKLLEVLGDEPSVEGYYADQVKGHAQRARGAVAVVLRRATARRVDRAPARGGRAVRAGVRAGGGAVRPAPARDRSGGAPVRRSAATTTASSRAPIAVSPLVADGAARRAAPSSRPQSSASGGLLGGLRVLDFSAFVAGPLGAQVLADLGAEVIKVEPLEGEAMRAAAYAVAACQRGKRSVALDLNAPEARPVVERLIRWADVVLHNFRVGVSARLGIDEATVARLNPRCGVLPRQRLRHVRPARAVPEQRRAHAGGHRIGARRRRRGQRSARADVDPDRHGGRLGHRGRGSWPGCTRARPAGRDSRWRRACSARGCCCRAACSSATARSSAGRSSMPRRPGTAPGTASTSAATATGSRSCCPTSSRGSDCAPSARRGVAPGRRTRRCAVAATDALGARGGACARSRCSRSAPAAEWIGAAAAARSCSRSASEPTSRDEFRQGILDDPVNRQLGRVAAYETAEWGHFEQIGPLLRSGPAPVDGPPLVLPGIGEHTTEVLAELGFSDEEVAALLAAKAVRQR